MNSNIQDRNPGGILPPEEQAAIEKAEKEKAPVNRVLVLPPLTEKVESPIKVTTVTKVGDIVAGQALSFENLLLLEMFIKYADLFEMDPVLLAGYPGAEYSEKFKQVAWPLEMVSYDTLVADIVAAKNIDSITTAQRSLAPPRVGPSSSSRLISMPAARDALRHRLGVASSTAPPTPKNPRSVTMRTNHAHV